MRPRTCLVKYAITIFRSRVRWHTTVVRATVASSPLYFPLLRPLAGYVRVLISRRSNATETSTWIGYYDVALRTNDLRGSIPRLLLGRSIIRKAVNRSELLKKSYFACTSCTKTSVEKPIQLLARPNYRSLDENEHSWERVLSLIESRLLDGSVQFLSHNGQPRCEPNDGPSR